MANLNQIQKEVSEILSDQKSMKSDIKAILELLGSQNPIKESLETVAAKIVNDLTKLINDCPCNKEILEALGKQPKDQLVEQPKEKGKGLNLGKYSYPNYGVGNEELGSSGNPKALTWPFKAPAGWPNQF
uniref:Virion-associated protein n=1 Tax=Cauliflower mosaic virus TaxID=10641 RepID=U5KPN5_9VIRU|nr:helper component protein [Cauliflower mosaic virus]BAO53300.1 DNA-binding protein [Cauliflower mosaic virus]